MFHNSIEMLISSVMFNPRTSQSISISEISPLFLPAIQFMRQPDEEKLQFRAETELHQPYYNIADVDL